MIFDKLSSVSKLLLSGSVGIIPTDTVYGIVCLASDTAAVKRLYSLKGRTAKPGSIVAANIDQLIKLGLKARYLKAVANFWPSPINVVLACGDQLAYLHLGKQSLAVRLPKNRQLPALLKQTGALLTTSANPPGQPTANTIKQAQTYFGNKIDFYVDGGDLSGRQPSTIIRIMDDAIEVLRQGAGKIS